MNAKAKGTRAEHKVMALLEAAGYECARAAGSFGPFDVFAFSTTDVVCAQVKVNRNPSPIEREKMARFPTPPCVRKLVYVFRDWKREPRVDVIL